jgi:phosphoribosylformylglycinamidine cyclo-ligase
VLAAIQAARVYGVSHITGGGFYENIPRCLPQGLGARIDKSALQIPPIFRLLQEKGGIPERDMFNTFNMGTGMVLVVDKEDVVKAVSALDGAGESPRVIGTVASGGGVELL